MQSSNQVKAQVEKIELSTQQAHSVAIAALQENVQLKVDVDRLANKVSRVANEIDKADLPNRISFGYVLSNWRKLANLIASIISIIKDDNRSSN